MEFPEEYLRIYPEEKRQAVLGVLAEDPRPAYVKDEKRVYGEIGRASCRDRVCQYV